jgi:hypothetical protein
MKILRIVAVVGAVGGAVIALGEPLIARQQAQLARIGSRLAGIGYNLVGEKTGWLQDGQSTTFRVRLAQGTEFTFRGTCDSDCSDLDLELYDGNGNLVDSDYDPDDVPVVGVEPAWSGWFRVRVIMADCSREPCGYAVGRFSR